MRQRALNAVLLLSLPLLFVACEVESSDGGANRGGTRDTARAQNSEREIREIDRRWGELVAARDTAAIANIYAEDAVFLPANAPRIEGRDQIRQFWGELLSLPGSSLTFTPDRIHVADSDDIAHEIGSYRLSFDGPQGRVEDEGKYIVLWRREGGEWKVVADMINSSKSVPATR